MSRRETLHTVATGSTGPEGLPPFSQSDDRARTLAAVVDRIEALPPGALEALSLHLSGLETGEDRTLDIHALVGTHGRAMILDWERKFGPSHARKGGLL